MRLIYAQYPYILQDQLADISCRPVALPQTPDRADCFPTLATAVDGALRLKLHKFNVWVVRADFDADTGLPEFHRDCALAFTGDLYMPPVTV